MKFFFHSIVVVLIGLSTVSYSHAEESTSTATSTDGGSFLSSIRENVQEIRSNVQDHVENRQVQQAVLQARVQERLTNLAANISNRFDGIIARLQNITDRLEKRIEKEATEGKDVTTARTSLARAQAALDEAKTEMKNIDEAVSSALGSTDPRSEWKSVRAKYISAREDIRTAHTELRNTIINLKASPQASDAVVASSTPNTN